jgi:hypothetical protein
MKPLIDFEGINQAALGCARRLLEDLIPGGKFRGLEYIVRNPRRNDNKAPSQSTIGQAFGRTLQQMTVAAISFRWSRTFAIAAKETPLANSLKSSTSRYTRRTVSRPLQKQTERC